METKAYTLEQLIGRVVDNRGKTCPVSNHGIPLIATNCVKNTSIFPSFEKVRFVDQNTYETWFRGHPEPGDIVFVTKGSPGRVALVPDPVPFCIAQDMLAIRANEAIIDQKFLFALLRNERTQRQIMNMHVGTLIPHFKKGDFKNLILEIPTSRHTQKFIGNIYFQFSNKIELNRKMNETLEQMAQALFKSWFVDFDPVIDKALAAGHEIPEPLQHRAQLRQALPQDQKLIHTNPELVKDFPDQFTFTEELGWIPEGWEVKSLYDSAEFVNGASFKSADFDQSKNGMPIIKIAELKSGITDQTKFTRLSKPDKYLVHEESLLYSWSGSPDTSLEAFLWLGEKGWLNQHIFLVNTISEEHKAFTYFQLHALRPVLVEIARNKQTTGLGHVTVKDMKQLYISYPSWLLHSDSFFLNAFKKVIDLKRSIRTITKLRDTLLPKLISGELRVPEAEKLIADHV